MRRGKRRLLLIGATAAVIALLTVAVATPLALLWRAHGYDPDFLKIDACLDRGGAWDYEASVCSTQRYVR